MYAFLFSSKWSCICCASVSISSSCSSNLVSIHLLFVVLTVQQEHQLLSMTQLWRKLFGAELLPPLRKKIYREKYLRTMTITRFKWEDISDPIWCLLQLLDPLWRMLKSQVVSTNSPKSLFSSARSNLGISAAAQGKVSKENGFICCYMCMYMFNRMHLYTSRADPDANSLWHFLFLSFRSNALLTGLWLGWLSREESSKWTVSDCLKQSFVTSTTSVLKKYKVCLKKKNSF